MPQETAATWSRSGLAVIISRVRIQARQSCSATQAPVIDGGAGAAVGLDHVAVDGDLPLAERLQIDHGAQERPIRRWISCVRPPCLPAAASRRVRSWVARGSMPYSAVTQPRALALAARAAAAPRAWR